MLILSSCASTPAEIPAGGPSSLPSVRPVESFTHIVQKGETLWYISKITHADLETIVKINHLSDSTPIVPGQAILVPKTTSQATVPQTNFSPQEETGFIWPLKGKIITRFRERVNGVTSKGIDILAESPQDVLAAQNGRVIFADNLVGYGRTIIIDHADGLSTLYCGNADVLVHVGDEVRQGSVIGKTGKTNRSENGSLHFEIRQKQKPQNPLFYLD